MNWIWVGHQQYLLHCHLQESTYHPYGLYPLNTVPEIAESKWNSTWHKIKPTWLVWRLQHCWANTILGSGICSETQEVKTWVLFYGSGASWLSLSFADFMKLSVPIIFIISHLAKAQSLPSLPQKLQWITNDKRSFARKHYTSARRSPHKRESPQHESFLCSWVLVMHMVLLKYCFI